MYQSAEHIARFPVFVPDVFPHSFHQRLIAGFVALNDFSGKLVDHNDMIVFVDNAIGYFVLDIGHITGCLILAVVAEHATV